MSDHFSEPPPTGRGGRRTCQMFVVAILLLGVGVLAALAWRFLEDMPVDYADIEDHFKYGSTGGERESGFSYWIWKALPSVCADQFPSEGGKSEPSAIWSIFSPTCTVSSPRAASWPTAGFTLCRKQT